VAGEQVEKASSQYSVPSSIVGELFEPEVSTTNITLAGTVKSTVQGLLGGGGVGEVAGVGIEEVEFSDFEREL
jgi:hypothetical protein